MNVTIDASVWVNAFNPQEEGHQHSRALIERLRGSDCLIICPALVLAEVAATISRGLKDSAIGPKFARAMQKVPQLVFIPLDEKLAVLSGDLAAQCRLRAADAVYCAVSLQYRTTLVTRDKEQLDRSRDILNVVTPENC